MAMEVQLTSVAAIVYIFGKPRRTIPFEKGTEVDVKHDKHPTHEHRRWVQAVILSRKGSGKLVMSEDDGWGEGDLFLVWHHIYDLRKEVRFSYTPEARRLMELTRT